MMAKNTAALAACSLLLIACGAGATEDRSGTTEAMAEPTSSTTSPPSTTTSTTTSSTSTTVAATTTIPTTTTTTEPGSQYIGTTYSDPSEIDMHYFGGGLIRELDRDDVDYAYSRWETSEDEVVFFEKRAETGSGWEVLDVVSYPVPGGKESFVGSGCIGDGEGVDVELLGVARHEGNNQWTLLTLWRADRSQEVWVEMNPSGHVVEPATGSCELGAGDGGLP